jgi:hypothetical protein
MMVVVTDALLCLNDRRFVSEEGRIGGVGVGFRGGRGFQCLENNVGNIVLSGEGRLDWSTRLVIERSFPGKPQKQGSLLLGNVPNACMVW